MSVYVLLPCEGIFSAGWTACSMLFHILVVGYPLLLQGTSIHTSRSGMPFHSFLLKFHGKNAAMGRCDGSRTYMGARWKAIIMAETMVSVSLLKGEYIHHARRSAFHEDSMSMQGIERISGAREAITRRRQAIT